MSRLKCDGQKSSNLRKHNTVWGGRGSYCRCVVPVAPGAAVAGCRDGTAPPLRLCVSFQPSIRTPKANVGNTL
eukprot:3052411-Pleurochrysis_carterae.AAC.5